MLNCPWSWKPVPRYAWKLDLGACIVKVCLSENTRADNWMLSSFSFLPRISRGVNALLARTLLQRRQHLGGWVKETVAVKWALRRRPTVLFVNLARMALILGLSDLAQKLNLLSFKPVKSSHHDSVVSSLRFIFEFLKFYFGKLFNVIVAFLANLVHLLFREFNLYGVSDSFPHWSSNAHWLVLYLISLNRFVFVTLGKFFGAWR